MDTTKLIAFIPAISVLIVVIGWFINNWLNRKHEKAKIRTEYRMKTLNSFIEISKKLNFKPNEFINDELLDAQIDFLLFGYPNEIELLSKLVISMQKEDYDEISKFCNELTNIVRIELRKELGLPKMKNNPLH